MTSRFGATSVSVKSYGAALSASQRRLSSTASFGTAGNSVVRSPSSGLIRRHSVAGEIGLRKDFTRSTRTVGDWPEIDTPSGCCHLCGAELHDTGKGLTFCQGCHSLRLRSGRTSHAYGEKTASRNASKQAPPKDPFDKDPGASMSSLVARGAARRMSAREDGLLAEDVGQAAESKKIMAGIVDTGYKVGDRIKSKYRPAVAAANEAGWNPLNKETDEGVVLGAGKHVGEVLVKFDYGEVTASMKLHQIEHAVSKGPVSNVERCVNRRMSSKGRPASRAPTLGD